MSQAAPFAGGVLLGGQTGRGAKHRTQGGRGTNRLSKIECVLETWMSQNASLDRRHAPILPRSTVSIYQSNACQHVTANERPFMTDRPFSTSCRYGCSCTLNGPLGSDYTKTASGKRSHSLNLRHRERKEINPPKRVPIGNFGDNLRNPAAAY